eukprot:5502215-Prymnesium_polylepis.1
MLTQDANAVTQGRMGGDEDGDEEDRDLLSNAVPIRALLQSLSLIHKYDSLPHGVEKVLEPKAFPFGGSPFEKRPVNVSGVRSSERAEILHSGSPRLHCQEAKAVCWPSPRNQLVSKFGYRNLPMRKTKSWAEPSCLARHL